MIELVKKLDEVPNVKEILAIKLHYKDQRIHRIISKFTDYNGCHKAGVYDDKGWYQYEENKKRLLDLTEPIDYDFITNEIKKTLYGFQIYLKDRYRYFGYIRTF